MHARKKRLLMMTLANFAVTMAFIVGIGVLVLASIMLLGKIGIVVVIAALLILLASYLYAGERLKEIEREEERQEERVKSDYSYVKRYTQNSRLY